jgi:hypothetical protein
MAWLVGLADVNRDINSKLPSFRIAGRVAWPERHD